MRGGDPDYRGHVVSGKPVLPPQGETGPGRHEEGQVLPARGERVDLIGWLGLSTVFDWSFFVRLLSYWLVIG